MLSPRILRLAGLVLALAALGFATIGTVARDSATARLPSTPEDSVIAWHFVLQPIAMDQAKRLVDLAQAAGFNTVVVQFAGGLNLDSSPWRLGKTSWDKTTFVEWLNYAKSHGMVVIPEIKLLSQQKKFLQRSYPKLMFNAATYDPQNEEVYKIVFPLLDEIISMMQPSAIHIGHDEVAGFRPYSARKYLRRGEVMIPAELFLKDVLTVHDYLKARNVETWMWGDMLISAEEFPEMSPKKLHGSKPGYGKALRDKLPRDIVICDWQYNQDQPDFPSLATMQKEGFRVIGATFREKNTIRQFSRYASEHGAYGMMATTWFHVTRKEWDKVDDIIKFSGETFSGDFSDSE